MHFQGFVNFLTVLKVLVAQSCLIFCNPVACSLPGSSVHGIFQARALALVVIPYSRDLPDPGIEPRSPTLQADSLLSEPPESPPLCKLLKIMRKLGSLGKLQKPFWLLCYGVSAWLQISMACFSLLVLLHFCSPFLFLGGCNFSTICADFPDFSHFLQAAGALSFSAPADWPLCSRWLALMACTESTRGPHCSMVHLQLLTLFSMGGTVHFTVETLLCRRERNWLLGIELLKRPTFYTLM